MLLSMKYSSKVARLQVNVFLQPIICQVIFCMNLYKQEHNLKIIMRLLVIKVAEHDQVKRVL